MENKFLKKIKLGAKISVIFGLINFPALAADAQSIGDKIKSMLIRTGESAGFAPKDKGGEVDFIVILGKYVNGLLGLMGILFLVLIMYGGFMWMSAAGNEDRVTKAKKIIIGSTLGIAVIMLALMLTHFILFIFGKAVIGET